MSKLGNRLKLLSEASEKLSDKIDAKLDKYFTCVNGQEVYLIPFDEPIRDIIMSDVKDYAKEYLEIETKYTVGDRGNHDEGN